MLKIKTGNNKQNLMKWIAGYDNETGKYAVRTTVIRRTTHNVNIYEISKEVFDKLGISDNEQDEALIKQYGRLIYEESSNDWGDKKRNVLDAETMRLCAWTLWTYEDLICSVDFSKEDIALAKKADELWKKYNKSVQLIKETAKYSIIHTFAGYSLCEGDNNGKIHIIATIEQLEEFIPMIFLILTGKMITWNEISK